MKKEELFKKLPELHKDDKILFLTHNDMDGAGAVILDNIFSDVTVRHCTNSTMDIEIGYAMSHPDIYSKYDKIIVCDISCTKETAAIINSKMSLMPELKNKLMLFDHHPTAMDIGNYNFAAVCDQLLEDSFRTPRYEGFTGGMSSGTALLYDYLDYKGLTNELAHKDIMEEYVFQVAKYDTWDWKNVFNEDKMPELNQVFGIYGIDIFERVMADKIREGNLLIDKTEKLLMEIEDSKIKAYLENARKGYKTGDITIDNQKYSFVMSFSNNYLPFVFEDMKFKDKEADLYIVNYGAGISIRSTNHSIDVGGILKEFGGGGHAGAGGVRIKDEVICAEMALTLGNAKIEIDEKDKSRYYKRPER